MTDSSLSKEDLFILLETYQNSISLNTTLLDKQNSIIELQNKVIDKQDALLDKQKKLCDNINLVTENLSNLANELHDIQASMNRDCEIKQQNLISAMSEIAEAVDSVKEDVGVQAVSTIKDHSNINLKIYAALGTVGGMVIALLTLLYTAYEKMGILSKIAEHLGVQ